MTTRALLDHLTRAYGSRHARLTLLHSASDKGIYRVDRDDGPSWVLRQFPAARLFEHVEADAAILRHVRHLPVEQVVDDVDGRGATQVDGRGVIVTRFIEGTSASPTPDLLRAVGAVVGSIHATQHVPGDDAHLARRAGALPREDLALARTWLDDVRDHVPDAQRAAFEQLCADVDATDDCEELPSCLVHSDCHLGNVIDSHQGPVLFDWEGAGQGPAVAAFGWLLYTAAVQAPDGPPEPAREQEQQPFDAARVDAVVAGYTQHAKLTDDELGHLADAVRFRPLVISVRAFRDSVKEGRPAAAHGWWSRYPEAERVASRVAEWMAASRC
jgi:Ser/Thr protein kinase RdoA (MazF antagonist)